MSARRSSRRRGGGRAAFVLLGLAAGLAAAEIQIPRSPSDWATDKAGFLSAGAVQSLNTRLRQYQEETGHQVLVYIDKTTGGYPIEDYAVRAFAAWKPGRQGLDDGLILFILAEDRTARIEVGYGLEDKVTDAQASRIVKDILIPKIQAGDPDGGVRDAVTRIQEVISGTAPPPEVSAPGGRKGGTAQTVLVIIGIIIFLIILITNPSFALWLLINILTGGRGGGGGGGGGGFSGGGGRSGGGGASGRW